MTNDEYVSLMGTDPEDLFPPVAGGAVDTVRRQRAAEDGQAGKHAESQTAQPPKMKTSVDVKELGPELARARTFVISTTGTPVAELLGYDPKRRYAVIMAQDAPAILSFSIQSAQDPVNAANAAGLPANGFVLPVGNGVPVNSASVMYVTATSSTANRVSVMAFSYAED